MNTVQIMIVGDIAQSTTHIETVIHQQYDIQITPVADTETAISLFQQQDFDIILFSDTLAEAEIRKMSRLFRFQDEMVMLVELNHQDPAIVLEDSLRKRKRLHQPVYAFKDDALKEAIFNINLS